MKKKRRKLRNNNIETSQPLTGVKSCLTWTCLQLQFVVILGNSSVTLLLLWFSSVQFSRSVMSNSLRPHESKHSRPPCPSPTPGVHSDSRPSSQSCHPVISSSVIPFSSCPQSLPASESFPMGQLFTWGGQSTGVSFLATTIIFPVHYCGNCIISFFCF